MKLFLIGLLAAGFALFAQTPAADANRANTFSPPMLGFISGPARNEITPILGIPGAARLGDPVSLPDTVSLVHIAPGHAYALVEQTAVDPMSVALLHLPGMPSGVPGEALPLIPVSGALGQASLLAFSPTGVSAVLYSQSTNRFQILTGLPNSPRIYRDFPNTSTGNRVEKLAISDDAQQLLMVDETGAVALLTPDSPPVPVYRSQGVSALIFLAHRHDAIVCDALLNQVVLLESLPNAPSVRNLASAIHADIASSTADGKTVLLASPSQHRVWSVDCVSGAMASYAVAHSPSVLDNTGMRDVFLISSPGEPTHWLFVWQPSAPATFFVGAARPRGEPR